MNYKNKILFTLTLIVLLLAGEVSPVLSQEVLKKTITRGNLWMSILPNGALEYADEFGTSNRFLDAYPGYYGHTNYITPVTDISRIYNVAQVGKTDVGWAYRTQRTREEVTAIQQSTLVKNYNSYGYNYNPNEPEEYITGVMQSNPTDGAGKPHMKYSLDAKAMVWSNPKFSDFVLIKCKLTNTDNVTFNNFYYARYIQPLGTQSPLNTNTATSLYDKEYLWDQQISEDLGFIFYDDTAIPATTGIPTTYTVFPGTVSGDRGNPGNIKTANSRDKRLYAPSLYAFSFIPSSITKNKNGEQKVYRRIVSGSGSAPFELQFPGSENLLSFAQFTSFVSVETAKKGWKEANPNPKPGDASLWLRNPRYFYTIGPYDIAPGQSIEWTEVWIAGQMDRNVTMLGDTTSTMHFVQQGLVNLKKNWTAAKTLMQNNYKITENVPPPTPADQPSIGNTGNELLVEASSDVINGLPTPGVFLSWNPVHVNYTDPVTKEDDFAGYKIYQSEISVEGPWKLLTTLTKAEAVSRTAGGKVKIFQPVNVGVPYRYCVTSFDKSGLESAKTGFNTYPITAAILPSNQLSGVRVVPNPFRQESGFLDKTEVKRLAFVNIPAVCTIKIFTLALDLVKTIEHNNINSGQETWGSNTKGNQDYMLTDFAMNVMPGVYIYHIESHVAGHEGESGVGKFVIIK